MKFLVPFLFLLAATSLEATGDALIRKGLGANAWALRGLLFGGGAILLFGYGLSLNLALMKGCDIVGVFWGAWVGKNPKRHQQSVAELLEMYTAGKIKPYVSERFPFARAAEAISHLASRRAMGKVIVTLD